MTRSSNALYVAVLAVTLLSPCFATEEKAIPVNEEGEGNQCDQSNKVASTCLACSGLPFNVAVNLVDCCTVDTAFRFCDACVHDQESCKQVMAEIAAVQSYSENEDDYYDDREGADDDSEYGLVSPDVTSNGIEKRYGTLFMNSPKRYGRLIFGKRGIKGFRSGRYRQETDSDNEDERDYPDSDGNGRTAKRFGYILGSRYKMGKRGDGSEIMEYVPSKRYGRLFMGRNKMFGKRFGRLFVGGKGMFGKRSDFDVDEFSALDKRYGRLFTGRRPGTYFG